MNDQEFDFVSIGDIVTDAFIRIQQASVYFDDSCHCEKICLENGAKIPYEFTKVVPGSGNAPNAAVSSTRLGLKTALVTNLGDDDNGKEILKALEKNKIDRQFVNVHEGKASNYHYVLWHKARRTILIKHQEFDYTFPDIGSPRWIYLSSVGEKTVDYQKQIIEYIKERPNIKLAFQPGTFQVKLGYEKLKFIYEIAEIFFCNKEEAQLILKTDEQNTGSLAKEMVAHGPKIAVVTDGSQGAYMFDGK
ncbi:MAG: carbohydrate kinase family protein, partial [Candidatus Pacebacteria bacterium]|nr:carbohydrate kinase family protein [Candidatus Paceibacterota bacterium]